MGPKDRPFAFAQRLKAAANRWLQPEGEGGATAVVERIVVEQLLQSLLPWTSAYCVPVRIQRGRYQAMVYSGYSQSMIHQRLVRPGALVEASRVPRASTGFSPFELLFASKPRGVLDLHKEHWEEGPSPGKSEIQYVLDLSAKLHTLVPRGRSRHSGWLRG
ncbi:uncharacterized protein AB9W97_018233 isoform 3-T4 [Spinachia spinachia]